MEVYIKQIRNILEFGVPVWNNGLTKYEVTEIERVQKSFLQIALGARYTTYQNALDLSVLDTLETRRETLCVNFAVKTAKHPKHKHWFATNNTTGPNTRGMKPDFKPPLPRLSRYQTSPIPYLTDLLNQS